MRVLPLLASLALHRTVWRRASLALLVVGGLLAVPPANADENDWSVSAVEGAATVEIAGQTPRALVEGDRLPARARITTQPGGSVTLTRNGDIVEISPGSALELPADAAGRPVKGVIQSMGSLLFKIVTRPEDPFRVDTPYLAALVKGTVFHIIVTANGSTLRVDRGLVQVTAQRTRQTSLVRPGQTAFAAARSGPGLRVTGTPSDQSSQLAPGGPTGSPDGLSADLTAIVQTAATHPDPAIARAQIEAMIDDHPDVALEIAVAATKARPELAPAFARAAALARPDRSAEIFAVISALAPGQGVGSVDLLQAAPSGPMNFGAGPAASSPRSGGGGSRSVRPPKKSERPLDVGTVPGPSISGP